jgi:uncharacterized protein
MQSRRTKRQIDPIARLMQEHDEILMHLASLNKATASVAKNGHSVDAMNRIHAALRFIEEEVGVHNKREEEALFPVLERYVEGPTQLMRQDHKQLKKEYNQLRKIVLQLEKKQSDTKLLAELEVASKAIVQRFVNHIHKENHILFPLVQKFLTKDALREVARRLIQE